MDIRTDEIQFLVNTSELENFGFSFTRNSGMSGFGSGAAFGGFTRNLDLGIQHWRISMIRSQDYEDILGIR